ncbi:hypothetical protein [Murimonas intestini]|uniref:Nuclear transport factor 2 family protein n=1 Tax=Murimonas intestini TaxID=1337051 RepID=A0AB73TA97_9FIRM|nr:hypothetical protein [Murimonas intestini]MCR1838980.1 hypothetical protein [Murimonas intestini]MCR1864276.1 hypothetical protein [Murimonas intestini]MCR1881886.1 hypothetical protein [Murimonas intestini]
MRNHIIKEHFNKILHKDANGILSDFDKNLVSIVYADGKAKTMSCHAAIQFLQQLVREIPFDCANDVRVYVNRCTSDYGVLSVRSKSFSPFLSYTCIVKNGKISYVTLYIFEPKRRVLPITGTKMEKGREVKRIFHRHLRAMFTMNANVITRDYEDSAVVITNMSKNTCNGKNEIHTFCSRLMKSSWSIIKHIRIHGFPKIKWKTKSVPDGVMLLVCEARAMGTVMTETYYVKNGKIQFESSICGGRMLKPIHEILK